jgi:molecular chaperone HscB
MRESPFAVLGLPVRFALQRDVLEARWKELSKAFHPDRHTQAAPSERRAALTRAVAVNEAYRTLRDDLKRAETVLSLRAEGPLTEVADPALLMEVMELRESLSEGKAAGDAVAVEALAGQVNRDAASTTAALAEALDAPLLDAPRAHSNLSRLRYLRRFLDEVELTREALSSPREP